MLYYITVYYIISYIILYYIILYYAILYLTILYWSNYITCNTTVYVLPPKVFGKDIFFFAVSFIFPPTWHDHFHWSEAASLLGFRPGRFPQVLGLSEHIHTVKRRLDLFSLRVFRGYMCTLYWCVYTCSTSNMYYTLYIYMYPHMCV